MTELVMLSPDKWGLDPLFRAFVKLYVCDIHEMQTYPTAPGTVTGVFAYKNHPICQVDLVGVIVRVIPKDRLVVYDIDDGTGVISCACWKPHEVNFNSPALEELPWQLVEKLQQVSRQQEASRSSFGLGELLHVRGKIKIYQDKKELACSYHANLSNPMAEVTRMLERVSLYQSCYDIPFKVPDVLPSTEVNQPGQPDIRQLVLAHLEEHHPVSLTKQELHHLVNQKGEGSDVVSMETTLADLQQDGYLYQHPKDKQFLVVEHSAELQRAVLAVLHRQAGRTTYMEKGCHILHILEELRRSLPYAHLQKAALQRVLQKLEEKSEIVSLTRQHFQAMDV